MTYTVKCDVMSDGWDYNACLTCRKFNSNKIKTGPRFRCKLNSGSASEKRNFSQIWVLESLRARGVDWPEDEITVEYVGKRKRKKREVLP